MLGNQTDRLSEVIDKMMTRPLGRKNKRNRPHKPNIYRGRGKGYKNYPNYDRGYDRSRLTILEKGHMARNRKLYFSFRGISRGYSSSRGSYRRQDNNRYQSRQQRVRVQSRLSAGRPRVTLRSPSRDRDRCFSCRLFNHFAKDFPEIDTASSKGHNGKERITKHKVGPHLYEGDPEEDKEEKGMTAMCYCSETYSSIQVNEENYECLQILNQYRNELTPSLFLT